MSNDTTLDINEPVLHVYPGGIKEWLLNGVPHKIGEPAIEYSNGTKKWCINGKPHREDGPAVTQPQGRSSWWLHGQLHREDGPAIVHPSGYEEWWVKGKLHRVDGPAKVFPPSLGGELEWWFNDKKFKTIDSYCRAAKIKGDEKTLFLHKWQS